MAVTIKTKEELEIMREGGHRLARVLNMLMAAIRPGVTTRTLDELAEKLIFDSGGEPAFKGYRIKGVKRAFPATICASVNDEVVHAFPLAGKIVHEGDIIGIDIGMKWPSFVQASAGKSACGMYTDMAVTVGVGKISAEAARLIEATREALARGIAVVRSGVRVGEVSSAIEWYLTGEGLGIVRDLAGHGIGHALHEYPLIPNIGRLDTGVELREGVTIAIEPIVTLGNPAIRLMQDEWTIKTVDGSLSAHFEHTIAITKDGAEILTQ